MARSASASNRDSLDRLDRKLQSTPTVCSCSSNWICIHKLWWWLYITLLKKPIMASLCHFLTNFICSRALRPIFVWTKSCQEASLYAHVPRIESSPIDFIKQTRCFQIGLGLEIQADFRTVIHWASWPKRCEVALFPKNALKSGHANRVFSTNKL